MKLNLFILLLFACFISGCKDAVIQQNEYPFLITKPVTEINANGATFEAEVVVPGSDKIIDYGFIWKTGTTEFKISLLKVTSIKNFRTTVKSDLILKQIYSCKAYIQTSYHMVYSNRVEFTSQGSTSPIILDFNPKQGFDGDVITIRGRYFSNLIDNNKVFINNVSVKISTSNDSLIVFTLPFQPLTGQTALAVEVNSVRATATDFLNIIGPQITSVSTLSDFSGKLVTLTGTDFMKNGTTLNVFFNGFYNGDNFGYYAEIVSSSSTKIELYVPVFKDDLLSDYFTKIRIINGQKSTTFNSVFTIKKSWQTKSPPLTFAFPTNYADGFSYNNKGYMHDTNHGFMYEYNPLTNKWSQYGTTSLAATIYSKSLYIQTGDKVFRVGGINYLYAPVSDLWSFSFTDNTWTKRNNLPFSFSSASYFKLDNQFYVLTYEGQLWQCDFENGIYKRLNDFTSKFTDFFVSTFIANGNAYAVQYGKTWLYDKQNDKWIQKAVNLFSKKQYSEYAKCFTLNNTGFVLNNGSELYTYDFLNDKWIQVSNYPSPYASISEKSIFILGSTAYIAAIYSYMQGGAPLMYSFQN